MTQPEENKRPADAELTPDLDGAAEAAPFVPSPVSRRIWAWMGVVYAVIVMALITYWMATGAFLSGITGVMLFPLLGGLSAQGFNNLRLCRRGERGGNAALLGVSAGIMGLLSLAALVWGVVQTAAALGAV